MTAQNEGTDVRPWIARNRRRILSDFLETASLPSQHDDSAGMAYAASRLAEAFSRRGLHSEVWNASVGAPAVFAMREARKPSRTLLLYAHYDGQPFVRQDWHQEDPQEPVVLDGRREDGGRQVDPGSAEPTNAWRVYGRGVADDRSGVQAILSALDALGGAPTCTIKVFLDGQEEGGGPGIDEFVAAHRQQLSADAVIMLDGPQHASGLPTVFYGARGVASVDVTVHTALHALHSGNYGGFMPDANMWLAQLIATMADPGTGRVLVAGFYDDVPTLSDSAAAMLASVPDVSDDMAREFGIGRPDRVTPSGMQAGLNVPTLSIHTLAGGEVGGVIPAHARARIALRLVAENDVARMLERIEDHIRRQGYVIVDHVPSREELLRSSRIAQVKRNLPSWTGAAAWRTDPGDRTVMALAAALRHAWHGHIVEERTFGGSVPAAGFIRGLRLPALGISIANFDDNQHAADENLRFGNLCDGIVTVAAILAAP